MSSIKCKWCKTVLTVSHDNPGWYQCNCKAIAVDVSLAYFRVIANFDDIEEVNE